MKWWHSAFSSKSQSHDDTVIVGDESGRSPLRSSLFSFRWYRHPNRLRKVRQVSNNNDDDVWRSFAHFRNSSVRRCTPPASPQPLPLPELRVLLQHDPKFTSSAGGSTGVRLPSPNSVQNQRGIEEKDEPVNAEVIDGVGLQRKLSGHGTKTNAEQSEAWPQKMPKPKARSSESFNLSSAPLSPYASPSPSPPRSEYWPTQYTNSLGLYPTQSAPELPNPDGNPGQGNFDNSPLQTSGLDNSHLHPTSPPRSVSPLTTKMSSDSPLPPWESNVHATVHRLPRPPSPPRPVSPVGSKFDFPGVPVASQSAPITSIVAKPAPSIPAQPSPISPGGSKPEVMPRKSPWQKGKLIGRGTFGSVYVASNRETGALCAMKVVEILPDDSKYAECLRQLQQEIKVLSQLKHPNIVQYYGSEILGDKFYIYLEYVHPGSINRFIHDHCGAITESVVRNFTRHILCGLAYLHNTKTIHRDIKGANLLVDAYGVVKLADFGMAKHLTGQTANLSLKGSPYWMAPELLQSSMQADANSDAALAIDIWSLGCTIIEMMSGKPPWSEYEGPAALFKVLKETPSIPETLSDDGKDFVQCCFCRNPADRPSASKLLEHPFVSQSYQPNSCTQPLKDMRFTDNVHLPRDLLRHKSDKFPELYDTQIWKGKLGYK